MNQKKYEFILPKIISDLMNKYGKGRPLTFEKYIERKLNRTIDSRSLRVLANKNSPSNKKLAEALEIINELLEGNDKLTYTPLLREKNGNFSDMFLPENELLIFLPTIYNKHTKSQSATTWNLKALEEIQSSIDLSHLTIKTIRVGHHKFPTEEEISKEKSSPRDFEQSPYKSEYLKNIKETQEQYDKHHSNILKNKKWYKSLSSENDSPVISLSIHNDATEHILNEIFEVEPDMPVLRAKRIYPIWFMTPTIRNKSNFGYDIGMVTEYFESDSDPIKTPNNIIDPSDYGFIHLNKKMYGYCRDNDRKDHYLVVDGNKESVHYNGHYSYGVLIIKKCKPNNKHNSNGRILGTIIGTTEIDVSIVAERVFNDKFSINAFLPPYNENKNPEVLIILIKTYINISTKITNDIYKLYGAHLMEKDLDLDFEDWRKTQKIELLSIDLWERHNDLDWVIKKSFSIKESERIYERKPEDYYF